VATQVYAAPDYAIASHTKQDEFVAALRSHLDTFFPEGALNSASFARIVSTA
jgi:aldehyde dehydrogenase (NAD+)